MSGVIVVTGLEVGSNADILGGTLLENVPRNGWLSFEMQAADNDATNTYAATIQLPDNSTPMNGARIPCGTATGLAGVLDERTSTKLRFKVGQGGRSLFTCVETGDSELTWRVIFTPFA